MIPLSSDDLVRYAARTLWRADGSLIEAVGFDHPLSRAWEAVQGASRRVRYDPLGAGAGGGFTLAGAPVQIGCTGAWALQFTDERGLAGYVRWRRSWDLTLEE